MRAGAWWRWVTSALSSGLSQRLCSQLQFPCNGACKQDESQLSKCTTFAQICPLILFYPKFIPKTQKQNQNEVYDVCPNLSVSRHSSCFTQKFYPKPKNGPKRLVKCKVFIWNWFYRLYKIFWTQLIKTLLMIHK